MYTVYYSIRYSSDQYIHDAEAAATSATPRISAWLLHYSGRARALVRARRVLERAGDSGKKLGLRLSSILTGAREA